MKHNFYLKTILVLLMVVFVFNAYAEEKTSTLTFTIECNGSGMADDDAKWTITSDAPESKHDSSKGIHYGTSKRAVSYLKLTTSDISGNITKIVVNASGASKTKAKINVTVGGVLFGSEHNLTKDNAPYTFEGSGTGEIVVKLEQESAKKALYVKSVAVTYSTDPLQGTEDPENSFAEETQNATIGIPYTLQELTTKSDGGKTYESSNIDVATINNNGIITLHKAGETIIKVSTMSTAIYAAGSASYKLVVAKGTPNFEFVYDGFHVFKGDETTGPELTNSGDGEVSYSVENENIATVDNTGLIKALAVGRTTVKAMAAETDAYLQASASYTLIIEEKPSSKGIYEIVTDASTLKNGDKLIFVYQGEGTLPAAMGPKKAYNYGRTTVSYINAEDKNIIKVSEKTSAGVTAILLGGKTGEWTFKTIDGYLNSTSKGTSNHLKTTENADDNAKASITFAGNDATVKFKGNSRVIKYNTKSSLFSSYNITNNFPLIQIYRKIKDVTISFANASEEITFGDNYNKQEAVVEGTEDTLVYTSSDDTKVKFHGNNIIDILSPGIVTITATDPKTTFSGNYELVVNTPSSSHEINLTFGDTGYLTWVATSDIDFSQTEGIKAYQITEAASHKITAEEVARVPKGAAVLLKGTGTITLKRTSGVAPLSRNKMLGCTDALVAGMTGGETSTDIYVLGNGSNGIGFYMLQNYLQAGKGYLKITGASGAKPSFIAFDETTGIATVVSETVENDTYHNLQGVRVATPHKGIYIKNGSKVIFK
ncbi:Ig-like domain-containing protein [Prevotella sp. OH937_COT-195]|uniref:Ig-like domain-containing protein n=1 Tax=Prevotella sp. OH937_COT-195 TaxID=2491051 RepID=UPI000F64B955|nr:Ig-like domain-containing protein [Prevotella sp. OH937_COT-195]RRD02683.1 hypothetical protein EII32_01320 [Prevotella sp. OH937_COT-195]